MKKLIILVFMFVLSLCAVNAEVEIHGIEEGQEIVIGDSVSMTIVSTGREIWYIRLYMESDSLRAEGWPWVMLFDMSNIVPDFTEYGYSWDTTGLPAGVYTLTTTIYEPGGYNRYTTEVDVILTGERRGSEHLNAVRTTAPIVYPGSTSQVLLQIYPIGDFTGVILRELFDASLSFRAGSLGPDVERVVPEGREFKWVFRDPERVTARGRSYYLDISEDAIPGTTYEFEGDVLVRANTGENITIPIIGADSIVVTEQVFTCPITDEDLLMHINRWSSGEITNVVVLQIIEQWVICQRGE